MVEFDYHTFTDISNIIQQYILSQSLDAHFLPVKDYKED